MMSERAPTTDAASACLLAAWRGVCLLVVTTASWHVGLAAAVAQSAQVDLAAEAAVTPTEAATQLRVELLAGAGLGTRSFERPTRTGVQRLEETPFTVVDGEVRATGWPDAAFSLGALLHYQTSIGMRVEAQPLFAYPEEVDVRSERLELSVVPRFRLGDDGTSSLAFPVGVALRAFVPEVRELSIPAYSLFGPHLRAEFGLSFTDTIALRLGPEAQWVVFVDDSLRDEGVDSTGLGLGGEGALEIRLSSRFAVELSYRESHVFASHVSAGHAFGDVERFVIARLAGVL